MSKAEIRDGAKNGQIDAVTKDGRSGEPKTGYPRIALPPRVTQTIEIPLEYGSINLFESNRLTNLRTYLRCKVLPNAGQPNQAPIISSGRSMMP